MTPNEPTRPAAAAHPVDRLEREHALVVRVLDAAELELARLEDGDAVRPAFWLKLVEFLSCFCDRWHHRKEEDVLFAALERGGLPHDVGPTAAMRAEHTEQRTLRARLAEALTSDDTATICYLILRLLDLQRTHLRREQEGLFEVARETLDAETAAAVGRGFDAVEAALGADTGRRCAALADELCAASAEAAST